MTATITPYRSELPAGRDGFAQLLRAEWTKFRTVRGWVIGAVAAALLIVLLAWLTANGSHSESCIDGKCTVLKPHVLTGPGGEAVDDSFYFVHQSLSGDGTVTARLTAFTGRYSPSGAVPVGPNGPVGLQAGLQPWSKAGLIVKASTAQGSAYAAIMATGDHGVRMQYDYTHDVAGRPGAIGPSSPRWLRLTRSGDTVTGYDSADGRTWTRVGSAHLSGLPATVQIGLFTTSPDHTVTESHLGGGSSQGGLSVATGVFDQVNLQGGSTGAAWAGASVGGGGPAPQPGLGFQQSDERISVTGSGDIAPLVGGDAGNGGGQGVERTLVGAFAGLIVLIVLATLFITGEYRRGLIRTTLAASPRRGRVLAAKAAVIAAVTFLAGLVAAAVAVPMGEHLLRANGNSIYPASTLTEVRVIVGTAALLAVVAVLALAMGAMLRRSAVTVTVVVAGVVLPYILATAHVLPDGPAQWLMRLTPAAGFAVQQSVVRYAQVSADYSPSNGYFPLAPWVGFAVLCGYAAVALALAAVVIRRRDA
ncbi:MAG: ABC transporter permease subunit [Jatrophihabitantaceae bacterium]